MFQERFRQREMVRSTGQCFLIIVPIDPITDCFTQMIPSTLIERVRVARTASRHARFVSGHRDVIGTALRMAMRMSALRIQLSPLASKAKVSLTMHLKPASRLHLMIRPRPPREGLLAILTPTTTR